MALTQEQPIYIKLLSAGLKRTPHFDNAIKFGDNVTIGPQSFTDEKYGYLVRQYLKRKTNEF